MTKRITVRQAVGSLVLSAFSFLFGFASSRYLIDLTLCQAGAVLLRSAQEYERQQGSAMRQFGADYNLLERKLSPIQPGKVNQR